MKLLKPFLSRFISGYVVAMIIVSVTENATVFILFQATGPVVKNEPTPSKNGNSGTCCFK